MKKRLLVTVALLCASLPSMAQTSVTPILVPNQTFVDASGSPCVGCKLYTYLAGTTTPQPTYSDSAGTIQNTNPIILNASGGGVSIWPASAVAYKYVLKNPLGTTIWTVDNVRGNSGSTPCGPSYAIQFADSGATELDCDPLINIDPFAHAIQVGGVIGANPHFNLQNLATIPTTWTFDVTTPATALASLGGGLPTQAANTVTMNATGASAVPTGVALPNCPTGITYDTTAHTLGCYTAQIPLSRLSAQAADTVTMNATASSAVPAAVAMPTGCANGVNYDTSTHAWACVSSGVIAGALHDVTGSRALGAIYQNTNTWMFNVSGYFTANGSAYGVFHCLIGPSSPPTSQVWGADYGATTAAQPLGFSCLVPAGYFYEISFNGSESGSLTKWFETDIH